MTDKEKTQENTIVAKELLDILACPLCKTEVKLDGSYLTCTNTKCGRRYPIRDGIPIMLIDEAELPDRLKENLS